MSARGGKKGKGGAGDVRRESREFDDLVGWESTWSVDTAEVKGEFQAEERDGAVYMGRAVFMDARPEVEGWP